MQWKDHASTMHCKVNFALDAFVVTFHLPLMTPNGVQSEQSKAEKLEKGAKE